MRRRAGLLDERNIHSYRHGNRWKLEASGDEPSTLRTVVAESTIHSIDVINHETAILEKHIEAMVEQLFGDLMKHLYQTVGEAAESTGNTLKKEDHGGNIPAGFLAMLEKIEFGVDRYGSAQRPSIHVAPSTGEKFIKALKDQPDEYHLRIETISAEKERKAIVREAERISRFRWKRN